MSDPQFIKSRIEDGVAILTIHSPPVNALSTPVVTELRDAFLSVKADPKVKAIVITGEGMVFVAGADIREIQKITSSAIGQALARKGQEFFSEIEASRIPVIAAINGPCLGGGNELVMACHLRIANDRARFGQPEVNLGILPGFGGSQRLPRLIGTAKALEWMLTGDLYSAQEAKALGLVNMVVPEAALMKQTLGLAKKIVAKGRPAIQAIMEATMEGRQKPLAEGLKLEAELFGKICDTQDMKEGVAAFVEKRQPKFRDQ
ncbi:MAG: enoyl-CoA hydratase/isomerase family protein [Planctomycetes bacterium]|nr:enoyl-CoA hydratase/isomerase family protein [Planctomycetota bacterium]